MMKKILKIISIFLILVLALGIFLFAPIDRQPLQERAFYAAMMAKLDTLQITEHIADTGLLAGWHRENIIPDFITPMAGYSPRDQYENVHDSLFVNVIVLGNGSAKVAMVSYDLLITPPLLEERIRQRQAEILPEIDFIYFSASHTHNGIGGWDSSMGGQMMTGNFNEKILDRLEEKTFECIRKASRATQASRLIFFEAAAHKYVQNRLDAQSAEDGMIRGIELENTSGEKAILATYSAHATNIPSSSLSISDDYPGQLTRQLERKSYNFAMFMAGTVGSHRLDSIEGQAFVRVENAGQKLSDLIVEKKKEDTLRQKPAISFRNIPVEFGPSQMRIAKDFKLRDWAFRAFFAPLEGKIQYLEIGNLLFLGMPCDFSGEIAIETGLYDLARNSGQKLIVTSFNGDYVGYITEDHHYDVTKRSEIREMNWVGPYFGKYFNEIIEALIQK